MEQVFQNALSRCNLEVHKLPWVHLSKVLDTYFHAQVPRIHQCL